MIDPGSLLDVHLSRARQSVINSDLAGTRYLGTSLAPTETASRP